jgi:hypothetical protein
MDAYYISQIWIGACFIGLSESIKNSYTPNWYKKIVGNINFSWGSFPIKEDPVVFYWA